MSELLDRLIDDHKYMQEIQTCLKKEMHRHFAEGAKIDLGLMQDIMYYLRNYADCFHHPLEDLIYVRLRDRIENPVAFEMLEKMELEHAELKRRTRLLQEDFNALANGETVSDERLKFDLFEYIEMSETHIACENHYLFPAINAHLLDSEGEEIEREWRKAADLADQRLPELAG